MVKGLFRVEEFLHIKRWIGFLHGCQALDWTGQGMWWSLEGQLDALWVTRWGLVKAWTP